MFVPSPETLARLADDFGVHLHSTDTEWHAHSRYSAPGTVWVAESDTCLTGRLHAPDNVGYDETGGEFIFRQPRNEQELNAVARAAWADPFDATDSTDSSAGRGQPRSSGTRRATPSSAASTMHTRPTRTSRPECVPRANTSPATNSTPSCPPFSAGFDERPRLISAEWCHRREVLPIGDACGTASADQLWECREGF
jgi:hypothetical protein